MVSFATEFSASPSAPGDRLTAQLEASWSAIWHRGTGEVRLETPWRISVNCGNSAKTLDHLKAFTVNDLGAPPPFELGTLYPPYLRGQAYLLLRRVTD